jgi:hypothetical protein
MVMKVKELSDALPQIGDKAELISGLVQKRRQLDYAFREDTIVLEKKYHDKNALLYEERRQLVKDIPNFWRIVLSNNPLIGSLLTPSDKEILSFLVDVRLSYSDSSPSYELQFEFSSNPYFDNATLVKKIILSNNETLEQGNFAFENSEGCQIHWKDDKNACIRKTTKTQRNKKTGAVRETAVDTPVPSFFHFFGDAKYIMPDELNEDVEDFEDSVEAEMEIADAFKTSLIPDALDWFMNEKDDFSDEDYDEDDEDDINDFEEGENDEVKDRGQLPTKTRNPQETQCKQQ